MKVQLAGQLALMTGPGGPLGQAIAAALRANGASVAAVAAPVGALAAEALDRAAQGSDGPSLLVNISRGAEALPEEDGEAGMGGELRDFVLAIRHSATRVRRVVNVVSAAGLVPLRGAATFSAAQAGLVALTRTLAMELAPAVAVNGVAVGAFSIGENAPQAARLVSHTALKRPAHVTEIAAAVLFLADPANTYMTGHTLNVDGGWAAGYARNF
jgi:NAD(P)-dependent dehydrogenase (short-subunit alcohol dehydrogenase family)